MDWVIPQNEKTLRQDFLLPCPFSNVESLSKWLPYRFQKESKEHKAIQRELDAANERFKEYERKDVKLREDIKHLSAKHKKLTDKLAKDTAKTQAMFRTQPAILLNIAGIPCSN